jgi:hypothetical protein
MQFFINKRPTNTSIVIRYNIKMKARQSTQLNLFSKLVELGRHVSAPLVSHPQACVVSFSPLHVSAFKMPSSGNLLRAF